MNRTTLRRLVQKYRGRLACGRLFFNGKEKRYCILGAALNDAGVSEADLLRYSRAKASVIFLQFSEQLLASGVETEHEASELMTRNDVGDDTDVEYRLERFLSEKEKASD